MCFTTHSVNLTHRFCRFTFVIQFVSGYPHIVRSESCGLAICFDFGPTSAKFLLNSNFCSISQFNDKFKREIVLSINEINQLNH